MTVLFGHAYTLPWTLPGEPPGEPAPPPGILERVPDDLRRHLPDEVVDELLAGAKTEEEGLAKVRSRLVSR